MNKNKQTELRQRFGFRKLASGMLVSGIIGAFFLVGSQSVQADTTSANSAETTAAVVETTNQEQNKVSSTNEVTNTNTEKETTSDQETTTNKSTEAATKAGVADSTATKQDTTATAATSKKLTDNTAKNTEKVAADTEIKQDAAVQTSVKTEANDNAKTTNTKSTEVTQNVKKEQATDTNTIDANKSDKKVEVAADKDNQSQINFDDWSYETSDNGVTINEYKGTNVTDVVIPNTYDFVNAGIITDDQKAYVEPGALQSIARTDGVKSITVSNNGDGKLYVAGNSLKQAFETTYMTPTVETIDVSNLDITGVTSLQSLFYGETNLKQIIGLDKWDVSNIDMLNATFDDCKNLDLATWQSIANWDVSNVSNFVATFSGSNLTDLTLLKNWNTSSATNLNATFMSIDGLTTLNGLQNWDVSNVTDFSALFEFDKNLTDLSAIKDWDTSKATNMSAMFWITESLTDLSPIANWNTSNVTNMSSMFNSAKSLTNVDALANWDVSNVTNMSQMFYQTGVKGLVNLANWELNSNVNTDQTFAYYNIKAPNGSWTYDNSPIMILVKSGDEQINNGNQVFYYHYLTYFNAGKDATLSEGWPYYASYAYTNLESAKEHFDNLLKTTAASKDGYTFKGWQGVKGTEYGNSGLFGEYEPIFESNKPVTPEKPEKPDKPEVPVTPEKPDKPDVPVTPENPDTPDVPTPVQPTNPDNNNNNQNTGDNNTDTVTPLPEKPDNNSNTSENDVNKPATSNSGAQDNTSTVTPLATKNDKNSGKVEKESTHVNSVSTVTNTTVKAASFDNTSAKKLPQTGSENTSIWTILGLGLTSILGFFGLADHKKRN